MRYEVKNDHLILIYAFQFDRVDLINDVYSKGHIKRQKRVKRGASVLESQSKRRRVVGSAKVPRDMVGFLKQVNVNEILKLIRCDSLSLIRQD